MQANLKTRNEQDCTAYHRHQECVEKIWRESSPPRHQPIREKGRIHDHSRSFRLRKNDFIETLGGIRDCHRRHHHHRRQRHHQSASIQAQCEHRVPEIRTVSSSQRLRQHRLRTQTEEYAEGGDIAEGEACPEDGEHERL